MSFPAFTTEINFSGVTWTDVSDQVRVVGEITRGRSQEMDRFEPGTLSLELDNSNRDFDPTNTDSPYYPNVLPMKKIRVKATYSATTYDVFHGFIENWDPMWQVETAWVPITAVDMSILLSGAEIPGGPYDSVVLGEGAEGYWKLAEGSSDSGVTDSSGNHHLGTYHGDIGFGETSPIADDSDEVIRLSGSGWVNLGEGAAITGTGDFSITGWFNTTADGIRYLFTQVSQDYTGSTTEISVFLVGANYLQFNIRNAGVGSIVTVNDGLDHHFAAVRESGDVHFYLDGVLKESDTDSTDITSETQAIGRRMNLEGAMWDGMVGKVSVYHTALSGAQVLAQFNARTSWEGDLPGARIARVLALANIDVGDQDLDVGNTRLMAAGDIQGQTVYEHIERVTETEGGAFFISKDGKATFLESLDDYNSPYLTSQGIFGDGVGELPVGAPSPTFNRQSIRNVATVTRRGGTPQYAKDTASSAAPPDGYGKLTFSKDSQLMASVQEALSQAQWIVFRYGQPELRVNQILLEPHTHDALWPHVLGRELRDRITLNLRPPGGGPTIEKDFHIEQITHEITPQVWNTTWGLSPVDENEYWYMEIDGFSEMETATVMG